MSRGPSGLVGTLSPSQHSSPAPNAMASFNSEKSRGRRAQETHLKILCASRIVFEEVFLIFSKILSYVLFKPSGRFSIVLFISASDVASHKSSNWNDTHRSLYRVSLNRVERCSGPYIPRDLETRFDTMKSSSLGFRKCNSPEARRDATCSTTKFWISFSWQASDREM